MAVVVALASGAASARTMVMTVNKTGDDVSSFDFTFDNVGSGTTNSLWMVYGVVDGGTSSFSGWTSARHVADIPGNFTTLTGVLPPSGWGVTVTKLRFFLAAPGALPGADRLEYIQTNQSSGQEYIATSYFPNGDSVVETELEFTSNPSGNQGIFCSREDYQKTTFTLFWLSTNWRFDYYNATYQGAVTTPGTDRHALYVDSGGVKVDGSLVPNTTPAAPKTFTAGGPLSLFATRTGFGTDWGNWARVRLYSFRAWDAHADLTAFNAWMDGTSTSTTIPGIDLVPCSKNGVVGLYDLSSGEFLANAGNGAFTAGSKIADAVDAPEAATELVSGGNGDVVFWTGNGGADTRVSNPANWGAADNVTLPDLDNGTIDAMFATGGSALLDRSAAFNSMSFASGSAFTFSDSDETLSVGAGGISTDIGSTPTVKHTFNAPVELTATQTWIANTNATFEFNKPLSFANASDTLTLSGAGKWSFHATSTFPNDVFATGDGMTLKG